MNILSYKLGTTKDLLTSRAGLVAVAELMSSLKLAECIDEHFPAPGSNRGFAPSVYLQTFILMQHEGGFHLDDVHHLSNDVALRTILGLDQVPQASTLGAWLRKMGGVHQVQVAIREVNKLLLKSVLHRRRAVTLDIDATEVISSKADAEWTYKKNRGFMPMVGHIAETGQVVACDFRAGNASPASENLEFIQQCEASLPSNCFVEALRIDAAGYQTKIIKYCDQNNIKYAIRAKSSGNIKSQIEALSESDWRPLLDQSGKEIEGETTSRITHWIGDYDQPFTLIIQRKRIKGQAELGFDEPDGAEELRAGHYMYRSIATNQDNWSNNRIVRWYNQRAEHSENRIKELKLDFGGDILPCSDFNANELYFQITSLSYNLFALMRQLMPEELSHHRAITIRWRLYAIAGKLVQTGRQTYLKLQEGNEALLSTILSLFKEFKPLPS